MVGASELATVLTNMIGFLPLANTARMLEMLVCEELLEFTISSGMPSFADIALAPSMFEIM